MTMKTEDVDKLGIICRICLKGDGPMSPIFTATENDNQPILADRITSIAQVQLSPDDGLPVSICQSCHRQVDKFYDFRLLVEISDRALRSYLAGAQENQKTSSESLEDIKDLDCQTFLLANSCAEDAKDLFAVNTIIVPTGSDTEVWRICGVDGEEIEHRDEPITTKNELDIFAKDGESTKIVDSSREEAADDKSDLFHRVKPVALIKNIQDDKEPIFFTTTAEDNAIERISAESEELTYVTITDEDNNRDKEGPSSEPSYKYSCQLCLKTFKTLRILKGHVKDHFLGGKERIQICNVEKRGPRTTRKLRSSNCPTKDIDIKQEKDSDSLICPNCDRVFQTPEEFSAAKDQARNDESEINENNADSNDANRRCENCGGEIMKIEMIHRDNELNEDSSLTCKTCHKHFRNAQSFKMHLKRHTLGSRYNCHVCGKSYFSNSELARHAQLHTGTREYSCQLCEMSFFSKPELNRHSKYHKGEKKFECKVCHKTYYESGHLKVHERVHTGEKPFACSVCKKAFITKSKLVRHCKIHERNRTT